MRRRVLLMLLVGCGGNPVGVASPDAAPAVPDAALPDAAISTGVSPPYNKTWRYVTHNSYWVKRDNVVELYASGTQERILDQLLFEHVRGLEIDVHKDDPTPGNFTVYHTDKESNSFCSPLSECVKLLAAFQRALPEHDPVNVVVELKEIQEYDFDATHTPADLDAIFTSVLPRDTFYAPADFLARCAPGTTLQGCAAQVGWPTIDELRGKFIISVIGNWRTDLTVAACEAIFPPSACPVRDTDTVWGHGPAGWVTYATWGNGAADRLGFPMRSNWLRFNQGADTDQVDPTDLANAEAASIFEQAEDLTDPGIPAYLAANGVIRGSDAFTPDDQMARVAQGFQMVQTDYPWYQWADLGPSHPTHGGGEEPGYRVMFTSTRFSPVTHDDTCATWETFPSTTRPTSDDTYPNAMRPRGKGCLRAQSADGTDFVQVCRQTIDGEYAQLTVETPDGVGFSIQSAARTTAGPGDRIELQVCGATATAYSASSGDDTDWTPLGDPVTRAAALPSQGLYADVGDVLFVGTKLDGNELDLP